MHSVVRTIRNSAVFLLSLALLMAVSLPVFAADADLRTVTTEALKEMLDGKQAFTLIDARTKDEYQEAHIVTAIHITEQDFDKLTSRLPSDKEALLVFYCNGVKCGKSKKVAAKAKNAGYGNILVYSEGFPVWDEMEMPIVAGADYAKKIATRKLSAAELERLMREKKDAYQLVDVRDEFEFVEGHIAGAVSIPVESFSAKSGVLPKEKGIIVYCNTGSRSYMAYRKLIKLAYPNIFQATLADWKEAGFPVVK